MLKQKLRPAVRTALNSVLQDVVELREQERLSAPLGVVDRRRGDCREYIRELEDRISLAARRADLTAQDLRALADEHIDRNGRRSLAA